MTKKTAVLQRTSNHKSLAMFTNYMIWKILLGM